MRHALLPAVALLTALSACPALAQSGSKLVRARLTSEFGAVWPEREATLAVVLEVTAGWHVYWKNPGDSGMATRVTLTLPPGLSAGEVVWPAPTRFVHEDSVTYGYEGEVTLLVPVRAAADLAGSVTVKARVEWLVCTADECLPGRAEVSADLHVASGPAAPLPTADAARIAGARARVPGPAPAGLEHAWTAVDAGQRLALRVPGAKRLEFYPWQPEEVAPRDMASRGAADGDALDLLYPPTLASGVAGVLAVTRADGSVHLFDVAIPGPRE